MMAIYLNELIRIKQGVNASRLKAENKLLYSQLDFDCDLAKIGNEKINHYPSPLMDSTQAGDLIINNMKQKATIVSQENSGKILTLNFMRINCDILRLHPLYFIYLFNENSQIRHQKSVQMQGGTLVQRLSASAVGRIEIPLLAMTEQEKIGQAYAQLLSLKEAQRKKMEAMERLTLGLLEKSTKNKGKE